MSGTKLTRELIINDLESSADDLKRFGVKSIALIGSYARDEAGEGSDIDFLVEFDQGRGLFNDYAGLKNYLEDMFGKEADIVKPHLIREELKPYTGPSPRFCVEFFRVVDFPQVTKTGM